MALPKPLKYQSHIDPHGPDDSPPQPLELSIPPCIRSPRHPLHPPPVEQPLRIQIEGPLFSIQKLLPGVTWSPDAIFPAFPQPGGPLLATLTYRALYGRDPHPGVPQDMVVRDEYLGWITNPEPLNEIDYYGVTFDHLVAPGDADPEVLQINIIEMEHDGGEYARSSLPFDVNPADYMGKSVLAVPRCCQKRRGTQDRGRVNDAVMERDAEATKM